LKKKVVMPKNAPAYQLVELPRARRGTHNALDVYWSNHNIYALLEVDVTNARRIIKEHEAQTGEALSFTGYLAFCLARAVDENKSVQAYPQGRKHLVIFDDVDIFLPVERGQGQALAAVPYIVRRANHKSYVEIHREIRAFQTQPVQPGSGIFANVPHHAAFQFMMSAPWPLPRLFVRFIRAASRRDPTRAAMAGGTVAVTAPGMAGRRGGWGLAPGGRSVALIVGGIDRKPAVIEERVEPRDILSLTVTFDHDVVDGAPAARFVKRLVELVESGYGLEVARPNAPASTPGSG
jgi:pyruvate/2-oxoglutarate dehydrogenase complex dihydrolipoamide acyltransferase (E2) component